jgi:hypothetical protein
MMAKRRIDGSAMWNFLTGLDLKVAAATEFSNSACPPWLHSFFFLHLFSFIAKSLKLIHDPRAHLYQSMPMPQQLPEIPVLWTRYPDLRKTILLHQLQQELDILAVRLLLLGSPTQPI